jgi:hypothetical protein
MPCEYCNRNLTFKYCSECGEKIVAPPFNVNEAMKEVTSVSDVFACLVKDEEALRNKVTVNDIYLVTYCDGETVAGTPVSINCVTVRGRIGSIIDSIIDRKINGYMKLVVFSDYTVFKEPNNTYIRFVQSKEAAEIQAKVDLLLKHIKNIYVCFTHNTITHDDDFDNTIGHVISSMNGRVEDFYSLVASINGVNVWSRNTKMLREIRKMVEFISDFESMLGQSKSNGGEDNPFQFFMKLMRFTKG